MIRPWPTVVGNRVFVPVRAGAVELLSMTPEPDAARRGPPALVSFLFRHHTTLLLLFVWIPPLEYALTRLRVEYLRRRGRPPPKEAGRLSRWLDFLFMPFDLGLCGMLLFQPLLTRGAWLCGWLAVAANLFMLGHNARGAFRRGRPSPAKG